MKITINTHQHVVNNNVGTPAFARFFWHHAFTNDDGQSVGAGSLNGAYAKQVAVTYAAGIATIAAFSFANQLDSSVDAVTGNALSQGTLALYDAKGGYLETVYENIRIPVAPTTTTWAALDALSRSVIFSARPEFLTQQDTLQLFRSQLLSGLRDVSISSPDAGDALVYNGILHKWENGAINVSNLGDVDPALAPTAGQTLVWDAVAEQWEAGEGSASAGEWAVRTDATKSHNINHGLVHLPGTLYTQCFFHAYVQPESTGYVYSSGYGGQHIILFGFAGDSVNGYTLTGNMWNASTGQFVEFTSTDRIRHAEPVHIALAYDQTRVILLLNGVVSSITPYDKDRYANDIFDASGYLMGSDHQNLTGLIWGWQLFEDQLPYANPHNTTIRVDIGHLRRPKIWRAGIGIVPAHASCPYFDRSLDDLSGNGHHGVLTECTNQGNGLLGDGALFNMPAGINRVPANLPTWERKRFAYTSTPWPALTPPVGARIFDSFGRADIHKNNYDYGTTPNYVFNLGTTEVGNRTWQSPGHYGIQSGRVYTNQTSPAPLWVTDTQVDGDIRASKGDTQFVLNEAVVYFVIFNYTNSANYNDLYVDENGTGYLRQTVSGVTTIVHSFTFGTNWNTMRVVISGGGTVANVYRDAAHVAVNRTMTANLSATGKGFQLNHPVQRIRSFEVR